MAEKKVEHKDIIQDGLFDQSIKGAMEFLKLLGLLENQFKDILKETNKIGDSIPDSFKNIKDIEKSITKTAKAVEGLDKIEEQRLKLQKKLKEVENQRSVANAQLRVEIQKQNQANKNAAIQTSLLTTEYEKQSARLVDLRKKYKGLILEEGKETKETKKLLKEITKLDEKLKDVDDTVGQNTREVGGYTRALKKFRVSLGLVTFAATLIANAVTGIAKSFNESRQGAQTTQLVLIRFTAFLKVFGASLGNAQKGIKDLFNNAIIDVKIFVKEAEIGVLSLTNVFGSNSERLADLVKGIKELREEQSKSVNPTDKIAKAFEDFNKRVEEVIKSEEILIKQRFRSEIAIVRLERSLISLQKTQQQSINIANDDTFSFKERQEAFEDAALLNEKIAKKETSIAKARLDLAAQEVRIQLKASLTREQFAKVRLKTTDDIIRALSNENLAIKVSEESAKAVQEAFITLGQSQIDQANAQFQTAQERRKFISDVEERNLDILLDGFDNQKTINERIIADERQTLAKRRELLTETQKEAEESFKAQLGIIKSFAIQVIELNNNIDESEKKNRIERIKNADIESLLNEKSSIALNQRIRDLKLSEIFEGRQLEVIRDRRTAIQDLVEADRDLAESERESLEVKKDIISQEETLLLLQEEGANLQDILADLSDKRTETEIDNLRKRLAFATKGSIEFLDIQQELNDKLIEQQKARLKKQEEQEKESLEKRKQLTEGVFAILNSILEKQNERRLSAIDKQIDSSIKRQDELREAAKAGAETTTENLAFEQKKQAELELKRERQIQRAKNLELGLAAAETFSAKVQAGESNPLVSTILDITLLQQFIDSLSGFNEGTEMVGDDIPVSNLLKTKPNDRHLIRVGGEERIINGEHNSMIGNMSNLALATLADSYQKGTLQPTISLDFTILQNGLKDVKEAIQNQPVYIGRDYDATQKAIIDVVLTKNKIERNHKKTGGIW